MMLSDALNASRGNPLDKANGGAFSSLAAMIAISQRFDISTEAIAACFEVAASKPSSLLAAAVHSRIPFKACWFEWPGRIPGAQAESEHWTAPTALPLRMGVLLEALDDSYQHFGGTFIWEHDPSQLPEQARGKWLALNVCPLGIVVDWRKEKDPTNPVSLAPSYAKYRSNAAEMEALKRLHGKVEMTITPHLHKFWKNEIIPMGPAREKQMLDVAAQDLEGEIQKLIAVLCLINTRNYVSIDPVDLSKLNKRRAKSGKLPLFSYSLVKLSLSKADARRASERGVPAGSVRRHIVRGHFKVRKGGIYWWRPFLRGSAEEGHVFKKGYQVSSRPEGQK